MSGSSSSSGYSEFECSICMEQYDSEVKICRVICEQGHSVCQPCSSGLQNCPECRGDLLPNGIVNRLVMSMLNRLKDKTKQIDNSQSTSSSAKSESSRIDAGNSSSSGIVAFRCSRNHLMERLLRQLPNVASAHSTICCDRCQTKKLETLPQAYWHCPSCNYDVCHACFEFTKENPSPLCPKSQHSMVRMDWKRPGKYSAGGTITCDLCRHSGLERTQYWHCEQCGNFDMCMTCSENRISGETLTSERICEKPVRCRVHHNMQKFQESKPPYYNNIVACDICSTSPLERSQTPYWHCASCKFDICPSCSSQIQSNDPPFCSKDHSMVHLKNKVPRYYNKGNVNCDVCGYMNLQKEEYWHCHECGYDMCKSCKRLACLSFADHK